MTVLLNVAKDFSRYPGGRYRAKSRNSGEDFRERLLLPALRAGDVTVVLDGVRGYGSSFLEEVFGGAVRQMRWKSIQEAHEYISDQIKRLNNDPAI